MEKIIVVTQDELEAIIERVVQRAISNLPPVEKPKETGGLELAVDITGLSKSRIYSFCSQKKIPHMKIGSKLLFSRKGLMSWCEGKNQTIKG